MVGDISWWRLGRRRKSKLDVEGSIAVFVIWQAIVPEVVDSGGESGHCHPFQLGGGVLLFAAVVILGTFLSEIFGDIFPE